MTQWISTFILLSHNFLSPQTFLAVSYETYDHLQNLLYPVLWTFFPTSYSETWLLFTDIVSHNLGSEFGDRLSPPFPYCSFQIISLSSPLNNSSFEMHAIKLFTPTPFWNSHLLMSEPLRIPFTNNWNRLMVLSQGLPSSSVVKTLDSQCREIGPACCNEDVTLSNGCVLQLRPSVNR